MTFMSEVLIIGVKNELTNIIVKSLSLYGINNICYDDTSSFFLKKNVDNDTSNINIILCINQSYECNIYYNNYCRYNNKKFISIDYTNNDGVIFVDAGVNHLVTNKSGNKYNKIKIIDIKNNHIIKTTEHNLSSGDIVKFINEDIEFVVDIISNNEFKINNIDNIELTIGYCICIDYDIIINHNCYEDEYKNKPYIISEESIHNISTQFIFSSIISFEIYKLVSNKYNPINQWFKWSDSNLKWSDSNLENKSFLIIGAGSIGCQILNILSNLNVKNVIITDPENVEDSNMFNNYMFTHEDIGKNKAEVIASKIKNINVDYYYEKIDNSNLYFLNNIIKTKIDGIINTVNNNDINILLNNQCYNNEIPLFQAHLNNVQSMIPFITDTYLNSNELPTQKSYPACVIKNFPTQIEHTIQWAIEEFESINKYYNKYSESNISYENTIFIAMDTFNLFYYKKIIKLINDSDINWTDGRIKPIPIMFDINNNLHIDFIKITSRLICKILNIKYINNNNIDTIINRRIKIDTYQVTIINYNIENINEYMDWINIASNIRALNYSIEPIPFILTKNIYKNKKYKTISDSTIIAGLTTVEISKHFNNNNNNIYNNTTVNLTLDTFKTTKMIDAVNIKYGDNTFNSWYKFIETDDMILEDFINKYNKMFNISISIINAGARILYACFIDNDNILM